MEKRRNKAGQDMPFACLAAAVCLCNFYDLWHTRYALRNIPGVTELNPFCRTLLGLPCALEVYKCILVPLGLYVLYQRRSLALARRGMYACAVVFGLNTVYQLCMRALVW